MGSGCCTHPGMEGWVAGDSEYGVGEARIGGDEAGAVVADDRSGTTIRGDDGGDA